jgi:two-component system nitrate/nitrite response regulator NarL
VTPQRILVADPLRIFRAGVCEVLARVGGFQVAEAGTADDVLSAVDGSVPDVVLLALDLPPSGGIEVVRHLERRAIRSIVWSYRPARESVLEAVQAGAHGYLHKEVSPAGLVRALRSAAAGEAAFCRDLTTLLIDALHRSGKRAQGGDVASPLSAREREVLELIADGARNKEIAQTLAISEFTVKRHVQNILHKLQLPSRKDAAAALRELSLDGAPL